MGYGDELMATGMAEGAKARGKRIAFGDGHTIFWNHNSEPIFRYNPNIALPGSERSPDLEWIRYYRGHRIYNKSHPTQQRWVWNTNFRPTPGRMYFSDEEQEVAASRAVNKGFIVIEPNVPPKRVAPNKQWPPFRFKHLTNILKAHGHDVVQFQYNNGSGSQVELDDARKIKTPDFRSALAVLQHAKLLITCEGGLHHGAAAVKVPAVVLFGSFIPPAVTGYSGHKNLASGIACGSWERCEHCIAGMNNISLAQVHDAAKELLGA